MKTLKQKRLIYYRNYSIEEDGVKFISDTSNGYVQRTIKFEEIEFDEQIFDEKAHRIRVILAMSLLFNVIATISSGGVKNAFESLFLLVITFLAIGILLFFVMKERNKFIVGAKNLPFWYENMYKAKVIAGAWVSLTVTAKLQEECWPAASLTVQLTVVVPFGKNEPDSGLHDGVPTPGQLSVAVAFG